MEAGNKTETARPSPGEFRAYRKHDDAASEQVRILNVLRYKYKVRVEIEIVGGANAGKAQTVSGSRLPVLWSDVEAYDRLMANWQRLEAETIDEVEEFACDVVYQCLIPDDIAEVFTGGRAKNGLEVKDISALEVLMGRLISDVQERNAWFDLDGLLILSPTGCLDVAAAVCQENPDPILDYLMAEETKIRHYCKHGRENEGRSGRMTARRLRNGNITTI